MRTMLAVSLVALSLAALPALSSAQTTGKTKLSKGTVKSVSASSLVVTAKNADQTFTVDSNTQVMGRGIGTKSRAAAGKPTIVDLLKTGDRVSVTYQDNAGTMRASKIQVTASTPTK